jgi:hypothetical protein
VGINNTKSIVGLMVAGVVVIAAVVALRLSQNGDLGAVRKMADGSTLELRQVFFCATNASYYHRSGNRLQRILAPITPASIRNRFFPTGSGSFGFGTDGNTNLMVITVNRSSAPSWWSSLARLRITDEQGNVYDARWGSHTLGLPGEVAHGWQIRAFPRRSETLGLQFLAQTPDGSWTSAARFTIRNPAFAHYPQWNPESWPATKSDGDLAVTIREFQSGGRMSGDRGKGDEQTVPRKTRVVFNFAENGQPVNTWRVQKLTLSDATGNRWFPYFDFVNQNFDWVTNGTAEFFGALWPGENGWQLDLECVRIGRFKAEELWEPPPIQLPGFGKLTELTNHWQHDGVSVQLVALASPNTDHPDPFKWTCKWWGEDKNKIYSLAVKLGPELNGHRLIVAKSVGDDGREIEIVQHANQDFGDQAVFLKPSPESRELRLTFALQRSRFVQFLARPEFVTAGATNSRGTRNGARTE